MMEPVFGGLNLQDGLAVGDPLAVLVLLGAVAASISLSVTRGINACLAEASGNQPSKADDIVTVWLDSLGHAAVSSAGAPQAVSRLDQRVAGACCPPGSVIGFPSMVVEP